VIDFKKGLPHRRLIIAQGAGQQRAHTAAPLPRLALQMPVRVSAPTRGAFAMLSTKAASCLSKAALQASLGGSFSG